jgi:hypothetical protein
MINDELASMFEVFLKMVTERKKKFLTLICLNASITFVRCRCYDDNSAEKQDHQETLEIRITVNNERVNNKQLRGSEFVEFVWMKISFLFSIFFYFFLV